MSIIRNGLSKLKLFDVSMRDGLQSIQKVYTLPEKKEMLSNIMNQYRPKQMEIGSLISYNVLPQMKNSIELYKYATSNKSCDFFLLVPPIKKFINEAELNNIKNISLITSVSNSFQEKNVKITIDETKKLLDNFNSHTSKFTNIKLYVSCITTCPLEGKKHNEYIIQELNYYSKLPFITNLCLADTCGNMKFTDFKYILDRVLKFMDVDKLSLHLHVNKDSLGDVHKIIDYAIKCKLYRFDVTSLENIGGCSVTMAKKNMHGNLSYNDLLDCIQKLTIIP